MPSFKSAPRAALPDAVTPCRGVGSTPPGQGRSPGRADIFFCDTKLYVAVGLTKKVLLPRQDPPS